MTLLIDIGNTRIKWARLDGAQLGNQVAAAHASWTTTDFIDQVLGSGARPDRVLIANVGGQRMGELARTSIEAKWQMQAQFVQSTAQAGGVHNAYAEPAKLGVDRWLALIGARHMERGPVCVVSVGTAMTVDGMDETGRHLGGVIVPGPDLMVSSLLQNTSEIAWRTAGGSSSDALFAHNTLGAVQQGAVHALAALVERAMETMQRDQHKMPTLLFTGGASSRIRAAVRSSSREVPDLVLRGLAVLATESALTEGGRG